ncbi:MAG: hypothetical protein K6F52_03730 [Clostridia bacterium]|nr:hypothetical protein [Clostridia bacterium]
MEIPRYDWWIYVDGKYDYLNVSPEEREMLKTGICPECQKQSECEN